MRVEPTRVGREYSPGLHLSFSDLAAITEKVDLDVSLEPGHHWAASIDALGVSVCSFDLKHGTDLFDLLEQGAVIAAWDILEGDEPVGDRTLAAAVRTLALGKIKQLRSALESEARLSRVAID